MINSENKNGFRTKGKKSKFIGDKNKVTLVLFRL